MVLPPPSKFNPTNPPIHIPGPLPDQSPRRQYQPNRCECRKRDIQDPNQHPHANETWLRCLWNNYWYRRPRHQIQNWGRSIHLSHHTATRLNRRVRVNDGGYPRV
jgi:hypothetical protein